MKRSQIKAMKAKQGQAKAIDNAINQFNQRKKENINGKYQHPNSDDAKREFAQYNRRIKELQKERATIKGQMVLLEK